MQIPMKYKGSTEFALSNEENFRYCLPSGFAQKLNNHVKTPMSRQREILDKHSTHFKFDIFYSNCNAVRLNDILFRTP